MKNEVPLLNLNMPNKQRKTINTTRPIWSRFENIKRKTGKKMNEVLAEAAEHLEAKYLFTAPKKPLINYNEHTEREN